MREMLIGFLIAVIIVGSSQKAHADEWDATKANIAKRCSNVECASAELTAAQQISTLAKAATDPAAFNDKAGKCLLDAVTQKVPDEKFYRFLAVCVVT